MEFPENPQHCCRELYHFRLNIPRDDDRVKKFLEGYSYAMWYETSTKGSSHYHSCLALDILDDNTHHKNFTNRVTYHFKDLRLKGNALYSCVEVKDLFKLNRYIAKDRNFIFNNIYTSDELTKIESSVEAIEKIKATAGAFSESIVNSFKPVKIKLRHELKQYILEYIWPHMSEKGAHQFRTVQGIYNGIMARHYKDIYMETLRDNIIG